MAMKIFLLTKFTLSMFKSSIASTTIFDYPCNNLFDVKQKISYSRKVDTEKENSILCFR
jgi:hypothetical protein